ncbi:alpha-ketoacid dehydrogenase subunit beta [Rhodococcus qingshengii]|uniref:alpha-ketoacid dehydrogenase subunit beta n=1 Tax=Rhodococcus qingshengii TaxID=334542 RepID=UPI0022B4D7DB|nr:transketolase C-terminal domain-containing protein [Rhodococcus qingshengii]MCZ4614465.1 alpha-ketoacid dehydrogenase subunit beta [Rhodococcus qingshengii]
MTITDDTSVNRTAPETTVQSYEAAQGAAIAEEMRRDPSVFLMGQDIASGGFFGGTRGLVEEFGLDRIRNTGITEAFMVGAAAGAAMTGMRPIVQLGFADFSLIAGDEIFQKLGKWRHMHGGQFELPAVIIMPIGPSGGAGPEHSGSMEMLPMHFPGLKAVVPSNPANAKALLKAAIRDPNPVLYYPSKQLNFKRGEVFTDPEYVMPLGKASIPRRGDTVTVISYGCMVPRSLEAALVLAAEGIELEVVDLQTLVPLDHDTIIASVMRTGRAMIVHEAPRTAGPGAEIAALIQERCFYWLHAPIARLGSVDAPIPASRFLEDHCFPSVSDIIETARHLVCD